MVPPMLRSKISNYSDTGSANMSFSNLVVSDPTRNSSLADYGLWKRANEEGPWPVTECPQRDMPAQYTKFVYSACVRESLSGEFSISCQPQSSKHGADDSRTGNYVCNNSDICVDAPLPRIEAWCFSDVSFEQAIPPPEDEFDQSSKSSQSDVDEPWSVNVGGIDPKGRQDVDVMLTQRGRRNELSTARKILIQPRNAKERALGSPANCTACAALALPQLPKGTANIQIQVTMQDQDQKADLIGILWDKASR